MGTCGDKVEFEVEVEVAGLGPSDGFTSYRAFVGDPPRTRWGDYEAAVTDGTSIWIASEYIAQTCACAQYHPAPSLANVGSCDATLTSLGTRGTPGLEARAVTFGELSGAENYWTTADVPAARLIAMA